MATATATGAGVVLIEAYNDRKVGRRGLAVILFQGRDGSYAEGGGGVDAGETPLQAAARELKEESRGLFRLAPRSLHGPAATIGGGRYVVFCARVVGPRGHGIRRADYEANMREIDAVAGVPACWRETVAMTRVFVGDLVAAGLAGVRPGAQLRVPDVYGRTVRVHQRAAAALRKLLAAGQLAHGAGSWEQLEMSGPDAACSRGAGVAHSPGWKATRGRVRCYFTM